MKIKGVIFDLDGTLLNSVDDIADSLNFTLNRYGFKEHSVEKVKDWIGEGAIELIRKAIPEEKIIHLDIQKFLWEYRERYMLNYAVKSSLYNGIPFLLDSLEASNIYLNILSNKPHELTVLVSRKFFNGWKFQNVLGMRDNIPRKPDPAAALEIAFNLGLQPSQLLYIGDSGTDIETARNAKIKIAAVSWGFRPRNELKNQHPDFLVDKPEELLKIIASF
jgi:phosphoglycolate phosphatase